MSQETPLTEEERAAMEAARMERFGGIEDAKIERERIWRAAKAFYSERERVLSEALTSTQGEGYLALQGELDRTHALQNINELARAALQSDPAPSTTEGPLDAVRAGTCECDLGEWGERFKALAEHLHDAVAFLRSCELSGESGADHSTVISALEAYEHFDFGRATEGARERERESWTIPICNKCGGVKLSGTPAGFSYCFECRAEQLLDEAREALEFYANLGHYFMHDDPGPDIRAAVAKDKGSRARSALAAACSNPMAGEGK